MYIVLIILSVFIVYLISGVMASNHLRIRRLEVSSSNKSLLKEIKIVLLSDLHGRQIPQLTKAIIDESPDVIIFAGDMIDAYDENAKAAVSLARKVSGKCPIVAVRGNHFYKACENAQEEMEKAFDEFGVISLKNQSEIIELNNVNVLIDGIDDPIAIVGYKDIEKKEMLRQNREAMEEAINKIRDNRTDFDYKIVVCHRPTQIDLFEKAGYDLALTGHTHGGQIGLPCGIEIIGDEAKLFPKKNMKSGLNFHNKMPLIITSGIGYSNIKLRTFMPYEIVAITFI